MLLHGVATPIVYDAFLHLRTSFFCGSHLLPVFDEDTLLVQVPLVFGWPTFVAAVMRKVTEFAIFSMVAAMSVTKPHTGLAVA